MQEFEPLRKEATLSSNNQPTTTLVIEDVPSEIAYNIIMGNYENGHLPTKEEMMREYERRTNPEIEYEEVNYTNIPLRFTNSEGEQQEESIFQTTSQHKPVWSEDKERGIRICTCSECGAELGEEKLENQQQSFKTNYKNYLESIAAAAKKELAEMQEERRKRRRTHKCSQNIISD